MVLVSNEIVVEIIIQFYVSICLINNKANTVEEEQSRIVYILYYKLYIKGKDSLCLILFACELNIYLFYWLFSGGYF